MIRPLLFVWLVFMMAVFSVTAQSGVPEKHADEAYWNVVSKRAEKIVEKLNVSDPDRQVRVKNLIAQQYYDLNGIHDGLKAKKALVKKESPNSEGVELKIRRLQQKAGQKLAKLHDKFLKNLSKELSPEQVEGVKDGMTYGVVPITYAGYLDMIPALTQEEQLQIKAWLIEAREHAMDAGSSEEKHGWFAKYKGRINNYLSSRGYDLKKLSKEQEEKIRKAGKSN